ncbi:unnamed protein product [Brassica oleracea]
MCDLIGFISLYNYEISYMIKWLCGFHDQAKTASVVFTLFQDSYGPSPPSQSECMKCPLFLKSKSCHVRAHLEIYTYNSYPYLRISNIHVSFKSKCKAISQ